MIVVSQALQWQATGPRVAGTSITLSSKPGLSGRPVRESLDGKGKEAEGCKLVRMINIHTSDPGIYPPIPTSSRLTARFWMAAMRSTMYALYVTRIPLCFVIVKTRLLVNPGLSNASVLGNTLREPAET